MNRVRSRLARAVQRWMGLDLWMALGGDSTAYDAALGEHGNAELWARLLAEVRDATGRSRRDWRNAEGIDFYVEPRGTEAGWIALACSVCGPVQASAAGPASDLGGLSVAAQSHLEHKHADLIAEVA